MSMLRRVLWPLRVPAVLAASTVFTLLIPVLTSAPAQVPQAQPSDVIQKQPADLVIRLLRREALATKAEHEIMFAKIDAIDKKPANPDVAGKGVEKMIGVVKKDQPFAKTVVVEQIVAQKGFAVPLVRMQPAMPVQNQVVMEAAAANPGVNVSAKGIKVPAEQMKLKSQVVLENAREAGKVAIAADTIKLTPVQLAVGVKSVAVMDPPPAAAPMAAMRLMPAMARANAQPAQVVQAQQAQQNAMVQQWTTQIRPILKMEYQFIRTVCDPPVEKRKPIARAGWLALNDAAVKFVDWQFNRNGVVFANGRMNNQPEPRKVIRDAFVAAVKANLSEELYDRYRKEIEARDEELKRGAILSLVTKLDTQLVLSTDQREKISKLLSDSWEDSWNYQQAYFNVDYAYFPMIPDKAVLPALNDPQKKVWAGTQKVNINSFNFGGIIQDAGPLDDEFPDEPVKIAGQPDANPAPVRDAAQLKAARRAVPPAPAQTKVAIPAK